MQKTFIRHRDLQRSHQCYSSEILVSLNNCFDPPQAVTSLHIHIYFVIPLQSVIRVQNIICMIHKSLGEVNMIHPCSRDVCLLVKIRTYVSLSTVNRPLAWYVKLGVAHAPGMPGTCSSPPRVNDTAMHHGTYRPILPITLTSLPENYMWNHQWNTIIVFDIIYRYNALTWTFDLLKRTSMKDFSFCRLDFCIFMWS